jgi:predicted RNase H-like nuclease (RuvC/YqgF family)
MNKKKVVVDLTQIDVLEQRIIKATELIRSLRRERDKAHAKAEEATSSLEEFRRAAEVSDRDRRELDEAAQQIEVLHQERQTVRGKIQKMLELMSCLDEAPTEAHGDH